MANEDNVISWETYEYYRNYLGCEEFLEKIKGKKLVKEDNTIEDCGVNFIKNLLDCDWGRSIVVTYSENKMGFIRSRCLSDYFKENIKELLNDLMSDEVRSLLDSDKDINQMDEKEIKLLNDTIDEYYNNGGRTKKPNISGYFLTYLYKLDGIGVTSFIKNNIDGESIARHILLTSGLNPRASYYSGRGVMSCDLNEEHLCEIFVKLFRLDSEYAFNFIYMVCDMKTLGATEFINSFINLGMNKFEYCSKNIDEKNVSLDDVFGRARDVVALGSIFSVMYRKDDDYQISASSSMKVAFLKKIKNNLKKFDVKQNDKMYEVIREQEFIYDNREDYWDYRRYR